MVDRSHAMLDEAQRRVPEARCLAPEEVDGGHTGCVLAVELFDALPVHRVRRRAGELVEVYVGVDDSGALAEVEGPCTPEARSFAERHGAASVEGTEAEVAPLVDAQLDAMERCFERGVMLVIDYGERADRLYGPARPEGTLLAYRRHATNRDYLGHVGEQDLTAHVNFSALEDRSRQLGLEFLGLTTQDRFLIANGILETFRPDEPDRLHDARRVKARLQALQLIHPEGMGRRFKALALAKGCRPELTGLRDPFA
jgi:SAM-dependent MidA family methyltransferase